MATNNPTEALNAVRSAAEKISKAACTFSQAVKAFSGLAAKYPEEMKMLRMEALNYKSIKAAWSNELKVEGKLALYMARPVRVKFGSDDAKPAAIYEKKEKKDGTPKYEAVKLRTLISPDEWTPRIILEGIVQSKNLELAKLEAEVSEMHYNNLINGKKVYVAQKTATATGTRTDYIPVFGEAEAETEAEATENINVVVTEAKAEAAA